MNQQSPRGGAGGLLLCREGQKLLKPGPWAPSPPLPALSWAATEQAMAAGLRCAGSGWEEAQSDDPSEQNQQLWEVRLCVSGWLCSLPPL